MRQLIDIHADINMRREDIAIAPAGTDTSIWVGELSKFETELAEATVYWVDQERVQAQTDAVESIQLPYDYNDLFGHPDANDNIIAVVKQFQLQAYSDHNAEVARIKEDHKNNVDMLNATHADVTNQITEGKNNLQRQLDMENEQAKKDAIELTELTQQVAQLGLDKQDAEQKRDNAMQQLENVHAIVSENETLKAQIESLKQELMAKKAISVDSNDKLAELANKAKESTIAKANRGLARWGMDEIPTLATDIIEPVSEVVEPVMEIPFQTVQTIDSGTNTQATGNQNVDPLVGQPEIQVTRAEHEALKARVETIERHANIQAVA